MKTEIYVIAENVQEDNNRFEPFEPRICHSFGFYYDKNKAKNQAKELNKERKDFWKEFKCNQYSVETIVGMDEAE